MSMHRLALALVLALPASIAAAQPLSRSAGEGLSPAVRLGSACAPVGGVRPEQAPRIAAAGADRRTLFNAGETVPVDLGAPGAVTVGQRFFVRRPMTFHDAPRAEHTIGWVTIVDAQEGRATAKIDFACDAISAGDHLEPYADPVLPPGVDRDDASGALDFRRSGTVTYGQDGRQLGGGRDFMLANLGRESSAIPGARYALYRKAPSGAKPEVFAEAVVVTVFGEQSLLRITSASDAVTTGDILAPRAGGVSQLANANDPSAGARSEQDAALRGSTVIEDAQPKAEFAGEDTGGAGSATQLELDAVQFGFDQYRLDRTAMTVLARAVATLKENPAFQVRIEGHTCNVGTAEYNLALGERRAAAVRDYLVSRGIESSRLTAISYGEERPKFDNAKLATRRLNRRAELVITFTDTPMKDVPRRESQ
jgi:peptidoglycan-associated lipoprotein